jgi:mono/diheme cytochrome c family protein
MRVIIALLLSALLTAVASAREAARLYTDNCARCHDHQIRAPSRAARSSPPSNDSPWLCSYQLSATEAPAPTGPFQPTLTLAAGRGFQ